MAAGTTEEDSPAGHSYISPSADFVLVFVATLLVATGLGLVLFLPH